MTQIWKDLKSFKKAKEEQAKGEKKTLTVEEAMEQEHQAVIAYCDEVRRRGYLNKCYLQGIIDEICERENVIEVDGKYVRQNIIRPYLAYLANDKKETTTPEEKDGDTHKV